VTLATEYLNKNCCFLGGPNIFCIKRFEVEAVKVNVLEFTVDDKHRFNFDAKKHEYAEF